MGELQLYGITNLASSLTPDRDRVQWQAHGVAHLMEERSAPGRMVALAGNVRF